MIMRAIPGTQAVTRAVSLLKAFSDAQPEWRLADLARASGLHRATAHRLLGALEREGMIARDAGGDLYRLGPEAIALGARAARATDLRGAARAELESLAAATGETATLEIPVGSDMLIVDEVLGHALIGATASIGTRWPMKLTSTGKAVLHARAKRIAKAPGYAVAKEELERGYSAVGAAIVGPSGLAVAAISVGGPSMRFTAARIPKLGAMVRKAAQRISSALGHRES